MSTFLKLKNNQFDCIIRPDLGGSIQSMTFGGVHVLRAPPAVVSSVRDTGSFPLVPFSNRVAKAKLHWNGTDHPLVVMGTTEQHAMHGVAWQRPWEVLEASDDFAMLSYEHKADSAWPFAFDVSQVFKLMGDTLTMTLSVTNQAPGSAPIGLGWHPYFAKRSGASISFAATSRWEMSDNMLPTHRLTSHGLTTVLDELQIDHCFEGWNGQAVLQDEFMRVQIDSDLTRLVVFTRPDIASIAIEPVSHVNNAINLSKGDAQALERKGVRILQPGETFQAHMSLKITPNS